MAAMVSLGPGNPKPANSAPLVTLGCPSKLRNCQEGVMGDCLLQGELGVTWGSAGSGHLTPGLCVTMVYLWLLLRGCLLLTTLINMDFSHAG